MTESRNFSTLDDSHGMTNFCGICGTVYGRLVDKSPFVA
jgi:hypothetical protein